MTYALFRVSVSLVVLGQAPFFAAVQAVVSPSEVEQQIVVLGRELEQKLTELAQAQSKFVVRDSELETRLQESLVVGFRHRIAALRASLRQLEPAAEATLRFRLHVLSLRLKNWELALATGRLPPAGSNAVQGGFLGSIAGTVTAENSGDPIAGFVNVYDADGFFILSVQMNNLGRYEVTDLPVGNYFVRTSVSEFINELYDNLPCVACDVTLGDVVSVDAGTVTTADFVLQPGGSISGRLTEATIGFPLSEQVVDIYVIRDGLPVFVADGFTNGNGNYITFSDLPSGTYYARTVNTLNLVDELYDDFPCLSCGTCLACLAPPN